MSLEISPMRTSAELDKIAGALAKAQGEMRHPIKGCEATIASSKGSYGYKYADLSAVLDAITPALSKNGIALIQVPFTTAHGVGVVSRLLHESGQWIEGVLEMGTGDNRPQTLGSAITYARRYMASPMAGIASDDDDDGQATVDPPIPGYNPKVPGHREEMLEAIKRVGIKGEENYRKVALWAEAENVPVGELDRALKYWVENVNV